MELVVKERQLIQSSGLFEHRPVDFAFEFVRRQIESLKRCFEWLFCEKSPRHLLCVAFQLIVRQINHFQFQMSQGFPIDATFQTEERKNEFGDSLGVSPSRMVA